MTITADQYKRIKTFDHAGGQIIDTELLYMVMNGLAEVYLETEAFTQRQVMYARLTHPGMTAFREYVQQHHPNEY